MKLKICTVKGISVSIGFLQPQVSTQWHHSQTAQKNSASLRSSLHSLRIRMTSYPCNKYEQITPSYRLSVKYILTDLLISPL